MKRFMTTDISPDRMKAPLVEPSVLLLNALQKPCPIPPLPNTATGDYPLGTFSNQTSPFIFTTSSDISPMMWAYRRNDIGLQTERLEGVSARGPREAGSRLEFSLLDVNPTVMPGCIPALLPDDCLTKRRTEISFKAEDLQRAEEGTGQKRRNGRKNAFTPEEERQLSGLVNKFGEKQWAEIARHMPGKNRKQVREHYIYFLKEEVRYTDFTAEEDEFMLKMISSEGKVWSKIASLMPGKNAIMIKNHYNTKLKPPKKRKSRLKAQKLAAEKAKAPDWDGEIVSPVPRRVFLSPLHEYQYLLFKQQGSPGVQPKAN